jgi:hypothetical protein
MTRAVISSIVCPSVGPTIGRRVVRTIPAIVVRGCIVPPDGIVIPVSIWCTIDRASSIEPWVIVRWIVVVEPVWISGIRIVVIGVLIAGPGGIIILIVVVGLFIRVLVAFHPAQLRIAPAKNQHWCQHKEGNRFSYQIHRHIMPPVG